jgi:hypothetical protein
LTLADACGRFFGVTQIWPKRKERMSAPRPVDDCATLCRECHGRVDQARSGGGIYY